MRSGRQGKAMLPKRASAELQRTMDRRNRHTRDMNQSDTAAASGYGRAATLRRRD
jgi:hypothetical protein